MQGLKSREVLYFILHVIVSNHARPLTILPTSDETVYLFSFITCRPDSKYLPASVETDRKSVV